MAHPAAAAPVPAWPCDPATACTCGPCASAQCQEQARSHSAHCVADRAQICGAAGDRGPLISCTPHVLEAGLTLLAARRLREPPVLPS